MKFTVLSLFPKLIEQYADTSIMGRAKTQGVIEVQTINPRDFTDNIHNKVDDSPYGGGAGMVMMCQPIDAALQSLPKTGEKTCRKLIFPSPTGPAFTHATAQTWAQYDELVFLCGHYEGIDARLFELFPDMEEVSLGDFVLTGGELPTLCMMDAVTRLIPGAVQKFESVQNDSFYNGLLDFPHYTRPAEYKGLSVPEVLMSGNHQAIEAWRHEQAMAKTRAIRPDLLEETSQKS